MINTSKNINNKKLDENKLTIEVKNSSIPPKILLDNLLIAYKNNSNTEQLANDIIKKYPNHNLAWKILGAIKRQQGLKLDELKANIMAVKLLEQDFEALYNLAITYKTLNKIDYSISFLKRLFILIQNMRSIFKLVLYILKPIILFLLKDILKSRLNIILIL